MCVCLNSLMKKFTGMPKLNPPKVGPGSLFLVEAVCRFFVLNYVRFCADFLDI